MSDSERAKRHRWVKLRIHVYVCRDCGMGKVNAQTMTGDWYVTYHCPDGASIVARYVPPCEVGPRTARVLTKYADAL